jgi:hypothetical protein
MRNATGLAEARQDLRAFTPAIPTVLRKTACSMHFRFLFKFTRTFTGPAMAVL